MIQRVTQSILFKLVPRGIHRNQALLAQAQTRVATGKRILQPSDDPTGTALSLSLRRQRGGVQRYLAAADTARPLLESTTAQMESMSSLLAEARVLATQGLNGTLNDQDRALLADQIELLRERLVEHANSTFGDRHLFGGTATQAPPYEQRPDGSVVYRGNDQVQRVLVGLDVEVDVNVPGSRIFGSFQPDGASLEGRTGLALGDGPQEGAGYETLHLRHDATVGAPGSGLALVGAGDTILGDHQLVVDAAAGTVRLDGGPAVALPDVGSPEAADLVVTDEHGNELHLDASGYDGTSSSAAVRGEGSLSIDGSTFTPLAFTETALQLVHPTSGATLTVDATGVHGAGTELVTFGGTASVFDVLQGMADDLRNVDGLPTHEAGERLASRLGDLDRNHDDLLTALGGLGARTQRLDETSGRWRQVDVHLEGRLSSVEDADLADAVLAMTRSLQTLELAQASGSRMLQTNLLNYLR